LFFDDFFIDCANPEEWLGLLEENEQRTFRLMYRATRKKAGLIQIFAFNKNAFSKIKTASITSTSPLISAAR
jgi:hypothetical protein